jgi:hypothetical protein
MPHSLHSTATSPCLILPRSSYLGTWLQAEEYRRRGNQEQLYVMLMRFVK